MLFTFFYLIGLRCGLLMYSLMKLENLNESVYRWINLKLDYKAVLQIHLSPFSYILHLYFGKFEISRIREFSKKVNCFFFCLFALIDSFKLSIGYVF